MCKKNSETQDRKKWIKKEVMHKLQNVQNVDKML